MRPEKISCPLLKSELDEELCADAALAAEGFHPERFAPEEIRCCHDWMKFCCECANNPCNEVSYD